MKLKAKERIGEVWYNSCGNKMTVIDYKDNKHVTVEFDDGFMTTCRYLDFKRGYVKSPYDKRIFGHGYFGEREYSSKKKGKNAPEYMVWYGMMKRGYDLKFKAKSPTYEDCTVCNKWHNYQVFAEWYSNNYYEIPGETMQLDKDILGKYNKVYSPQTCVFAPQRINMLFAKADASRGYLPIGVYYNKEKGKYTANAHDENCNTKHIGYFNFPEIAFMAYKRHKEKVIKIVAEQYKEQIPSRLYKAMLRYVVGIND